MRLRASKWNAQQKIKELEGEAAKEDAQTVMGDEPKKIERRRPVRRQVEWDPILNLLHD